MLRFESSSHAGLIGPNRVQFISTFNPSLQFHGEKQIPEDRRQQQGTLAVIQHGYVRAVFVLGAHTATYTLHITCEPFLDFSNSALDRALTLLTTVKNT